jgi:hypothetical protein
VETIRALKDQFGDRHLAVERYWQRKKRTQGDGGSYKKLATACRWITCCAVPALREGHSCQGADTDSVVQGTPKEQMLQMRCWVQLKCNNDIRDWGLRQQLCLGSKETELKNMKQAAEFSIGLREMSV